MLHISESKADIPCLLTQKLQPVPGPEKIAKPPVAGCVCLEPGVNFEAFVNKASLALIHQCTHYSPLRGCLTLSAWPLPASSLTISDTSEKSSLILAFLLPWVWSRSKPCLFLFLLNWPFSTCPLCFMTTIWYRPLTFIPGWLEQLLSDQLDSCCPRLRASCLIILSDGSFRYVCHLEEFKWFQHIKTCAFLPALWPFSWVSPFLFIWFLWPPQDCRTEFLPSCARPLFSPLASYFWRPLSLCSFSILVPFNSKRRWNQYT